MKLTICENREITGREAAATGAGLIRMTITDQGFARIILATGASQLEMLGQLIKEDIDWSKVEVFHLDEYKGIPETHRASFRKYLKERFEMRVENLRAFYYINADSSDLEKELIRLNNLISEKPIDVAFVGIGENGHLAFNDPPADFETPEPYLVVTLDKKCRQQQLNEGWFPTFDDVPDQAVSMSITQIMKSTHIINTVPDKRKAEAVRGALNGPVNTGCPASILQSHNNCYTFLDKDSASLLKTD